MTTEMTRPTWKPATEHGELTAAKLKKLPDSAFAFPEQRREPLTDEARVRAALARFDQIEGVSDDERDLAFANIKRAAYHYGMSVLESDWRELGKRRPRRRKVARF